MAVSMAAPAEPAAPTSSPSSTMATIKLPLLTLPRYLYRVQYSRTQTVYSPHTGLHAAISSTSWGRPDALTLQRAILSHFNWNSRVPSPFISTFADAKHAAHWGHRLPGKQAVTVLKIATRKLGPQVKVFQGLGQNEIMFFHTVPPRAIAREVVPLKRFAARVLVA
ncbi:hypothetical protein BZA05DRAFT_397822 [Tricharina praecox]|uniref:uncharacterized protein n=1 Tax=Tricharina praecox TaxID=43433 RepID=UPI00221F7459|nr:uncharacterized protein BZA05DRAFT_397822 [Tricharina praecox]KAI5851785.1 hypothetical protein BZA05DRAFT_397822 [Tricharina praecox]